MSLEACVPTEKQPVATKQSVWFELRPTDDRDHLDLDTGEVFQDVNYAKLHKKEQKLIDASITIRAADASYYKYNTMRYMPEVSGDDYSSPSSIHFDLFIAPTAFSVLEDNIRNDLFPDTITIELLDDPSKFFTSRDIPKKTPVIEFGWEPDGSGMIWHNKEQGNRAIAIQSARFDYEVVKPQYDKYKPGHPLPLQSASPADPTYEQVAVVQTNLTEILKYLRWTITGVVIVMVLLGIIFVQQGRSP